MTDDNNVKLHVTGTQVVDNEETVMDFFVEGCLETTEAGFHLEYTEPDDGQNRQQTTFLKYTDGAVTVGRDNGTGLVIEHGRRHVCQYVTPFGNMIFGISGGEIIVKRSDVRLDMEFDYAIDFNTKLASKNKLKITAVPIA